MAERTRSTSDVLPTLNDAAWPGVSAILSSTISFISRLDRFHFTEEGRNEFRHRGVNGHRALQRGEGDPCVHRVENSMDRLVAAGSENSRPEDLMCLSISDRHHKSLRFALLDRAADARHRSAANEEPTSSGAGLRLGHADAAERRIGVEGIAQNAIAKAPPLAVEEVRRDNLEVVIGGVGEGAA